MRRFTRSELAGLAEIGLFKCAVESDMLPATGGLIDDKAVNVRAEALTIHKEGRMSEGKPVGVLVGVHPHGLGGLILHAAHHVDADSLDEDSTRRASARSRS
eukprot:1943305-Pleurochrysis_carterae.AAC.1